jgi:hypothetical protein
MVLSLTGAGAVTKAPTTITSGTGSFVQRLINVSFTLANGQFIEGSSQGSPTAASGVNTATVSGLRASARINKAGGSVMGELDLQVWGMTRSLMDQLSTLGQAVQLLTRNTVTITAGDAISGMGTVFIGTTVNCWGDYNSAPEVPFHVEAQTAAAGAVIPMPPTSISGSADVATMLSGLATRLSLKFENNGINTKISNAYYAGSARDQVLAIVRDANINWNNGDDGILAIWPKGKSRGGSIPYIAPEHGLIGYPTYTANGIEVRCIFNPSIGLGGQIQVQSSLKEASKNWIVYGMNHSLDAMLPGGLWESRLYCYPIGAPTPILTPGT